MENPLSPELNALLEASRKSFTADQERRLLQAAQSAPENTRLLCELLYATGCRLSEALAVRRDHLDTDRNLIVFHTLKQRKSVLRAVPLPAYMVRELAMMPVGRNQRLFPFSRWTALRRLKPLMERAGIAEPLANSRTFRHGYNDRGKRSGSPDHCRRALLGHRTQSANDRYGALMGEELREFAELSWGLCATPNR